MIVVYGTVCLDRVLLVPALPIQGGYVEIDKWHDFLGGEAANTAVALAHWGDEVSLYGNPIGKGSDAEKLASLLTASGVTSAYVPQDDGEAPVCTILVTPDGQRTMLGQGFKDLESRADLGALPLIQDAWFTADSNHGRLAREAARLAADAGMKSYLMDFDWEVDEVTPGSWWQSSMSWEGVASKMGKARAAVKEHAMTYGCHALLSFGGDGICYADPQGSEWRLPAFGVDDVKDTTGAGDVFRAGMLHGLSSGWGRSKCLAVASAAAALNCTGLGATGGLATEQEILCFMESQPDVLRQFERVD